MADESSSGGDRCYVFGVHPKPGNAVCALEADIVCQAGVGLVYRGNYALSRLDNLPVAEIIGAVGLYTLAYSQYWGNIFGVHPVRDVGVFRLHVVRDGVAGAKSVYVP